MVGPRKSKIVETDIPRINDNQILVKVKYTGMCHSEWYPWSTAQGGEEFGHETMGYVADVGKNVVGFKTGDRVTGLVGGGYREYIVMEPDKTMIIPENIADEDAVVEPIGCLMSAGSRMMPQLQHGDIELKSAVTNISHDLRTPLTAICGYLDLLMQEPQSPKSARYLAVVRERTDAMRDLTEELLRYSVIVGTTEELHFGPVCLNDILEQSLVGFYGTLSERGIMPEIRISEQAVVRMLDKTALRRIYDNVLSNAAKYSDGDLTVCLLPDGTAHFENHAKNLDSLQTAHLFERFYTVNTARSATGLGLSIAKLLTEKMGGNITAEYNKGKLSICILFSE